MSTTESYTAILSTASGKKNIMFDASDINGAFRVARISCSQLYGGGRVVKCVPSYLA